MLEIDNNLQQILHNATEPLVLVRSILASQPTLSDAVDPDARALILSCLDKDVAARPRTAAEVVALLDDDRANSGAWSPSRSEAQSSSRPRGDSSTAAMKLWAGIRRPISVFTRK